MQHLGVKRAFCLVATIACGVAVVALDGGAIAAASPGDRDPSFGKAGIVKLNHRDFGFKKPPGGGIAVEDVAAAEDGYLVAVEARKLRGVSDRPVLAKVLPSGKLDESFGNQGVAVARTTRWSYSSNIIGSEEDSIFLLRSHWVAPVGPSITEVLKFDRDGRLDEGFGQDGVATLRDCGTTEGVVYGTGRILVADCRGEELIWLTPDGSVDEEMPTAAALGITFVHDLAISPDGLIHLLVRESPADGNPDLFVVRLQPDGQLDPTYGDHGSQYVEAENNDDRGSAIGIDDRGRVVILTRRFPHGFSDNGRVIHRLTVDGQPDESFGTEGQVRLAELPWNELARTYNLDLTVDDQGRIILWGATSLFPRRPGAGIARLLPSGSLDESFGSDGATALPGHAHPWLALDRQGRMVTIGSLERSIALTRYLTSPGPADMDADGVRDEADLCPRVAAELRRRDGCRLIPGGVSLRYSPEERLLYGRIGAPDVLCRWESTLRVWRVRKRRPNKQIKRMTLPFTGHWTMPLGSRRGSFFVTVDSRVAPDAGRCVPKRSRKVTVR